MHGYLREGGIGLCCVCSLVPVARLGEQRWHSLFLPLERCAMGFITSSIRTSKVTPEPLANCQAAVPALSHWPFARRLTPSLSPWPIPR